MSRSERVDIPGEIGVSHLCRIYGVTHATVQQMVADGVIPPADRVTDGGRPKWLTVKLEATLRRRGELVAERMERGAA